MLQLNYKRVLSNGKEVGVYNEKVSNGIIDKYVGPFDTLEECKEYCDNYTDSYRMGYNGRANPSIIESKHYAFCTRWTSCD